MLGSLSAAGLLATGGLNDLWRSTDKASALTRQALPPNVWPSGWGVPDSAWFREWGLAGPGTCTSFGDQECATGVPTVIPGAGALRNLAGGLSLPGLGIPLGGIGAGSFEYNLFGSFGPWNMGGSQSSLWELRTILQGAFHVHEKVEGSADATVKSLITAHDNIAPQRKFPGGLPEWNMLSPGDGTYAALYPFGWTTYNVFQSKVSMRFWSPIVAKQDEPTSMPVAFFDVGLANPTDQVVDLSVMLTFPNATSHPANPAPTPTNPGTIRTGLYSQFDTDGASGVSGVTLGSDHPTNSPDAFKSEWTIAAVPSEGQTLTYATSWNAAGNGSDIYAPFSATGLLPNAAIDASNTAGAVAVAVQLQPGQETTVRFALSWDFPQVWYGSNNPTGRRAIWMRRYTEFLGAETTATNDYVAGSYPFKQAFTIAKHELERHDERLEAVEAWWKPIAVNEHNPDWLPRAALNELYHLVMNASFWENGLVNPHTGGTTTIIPTPVPGGAPRLGAEIPGTHLFFFIDGGNGGASTNEMDMDSYGYLACARLFPNVEVGRIRAWLQLVKQNIIRGGPARCPQQLSPNAGPYISATANIQSESALAPDVYGVVQNNPANPNDLGALFAPTGGSSFRDCNYKLLHRTYALSKELPAAEGDSLIAYAYPTMLAMLRRMYFFRPPGSHLPMDPPSNNPPNSMDQIPVDGHGIYNCGLYMLSLQIMSVLTPKAKALGVVEATPAVQTEMDTELAAARAEYEAIFWNPATGRYRFCDGTGGITGRTGRINGSNPKIVTPPDSVYVDGFSGHAIGSQLGLPPLINLEHARTHWNNTIDAYLGFMDPLGKRIGPPTMLDENLHHYPAFPIPGLGSMPETSEVLPGIAWMGIAAALHIGRQTADVALINKAQMLGEAVSSMIYDDSATSRGYAFATPESWFVDFPDQQRFSGYTRGRSVWSVVDAVEQTTARGLVDVVRAALAALVVSDKNDRKRVDDAIANLDKALNPDNWADAIHPKPGARGEKVFHELELAVKALVGMKVPSAAGNAASTLAEIAKMIAVVAIAEAPGQGVRAQKIETANQFLTTGDVELGAGKFDKAIASYRQAWKQVT